MKNVDGVNLVAQERIKVLAGELGTSHGVEMPTAPIVIMSDGTPEGTVLIVQGQVVAFDHIDLYCSQGEYGGCSMSITMRDVDSDGMEVSKTLTMRKDKMGPPVCCEKAAKVDPSAKVRNRGDVVFDNKHPKVTDNKDHFPINDADQARNALARVAQFDAAPKWWSGSLKQLQSAVRSAVSSKFPKINVTS